MLGLHCSRAAGICILAKMLLDLAESIGESLTVKNSLYGKISVGKSRCYREAFRMIYRSKGTSSRSNHPHTA